MAGFNNLKGLLTPEAVADAAEFDPKDPANKQEVGGLMKFTPQGLRFAIACSMRAKADMPSQQRWTSALVQPTIATKHGRNLAA